MLNIREIKTILKKYNIRPNKRLGQNFLIDGNIQKKIIEALELSKEDSIYEIGAGLGTLTEEVCKRAGSVMAIEKDRRLYDYVTKNLKQDNLKLILGDALKEDILLDDTPNKLKVIGNLPYCISSPLLIHFINNRKSIDSIFITVQKEFAERIIAKEKTKARGSISCFAQFYSQPEILFKIKRSCFYPAPKVDSCLLKIKIRNQCLYLTNEQKLFKIIRTCFEKRRKTILNGLFSIGGFGSKHEIKETLDKLSISPNTRPESLSLQEFVRIAEVLQ